MTDQATAPPRTPANPPPLVDRATLRLAALIAGLVTSLVVGFGLGRATVPGTPAGVSLAGGGAGHSHPAGTAPHDHGGGGGGGGDGLSVGAGGYTLVPETTELRAGTPQDFRFRIIGPDRKPVTSFAIVHDKPLHMIVTHRDLTDYQHLHPDMAPDGTWQIPLELPRAGAWRVFTDFTAIDAAGSPTALTLGVDLTVAGDYRREPLPAPARETTVDGLTVSYEGTPQIGAVAPVLFRVARDGAPVSDLERYLGAYGHLVVLREGDCGYVHVHPEEELAGDAIRFWLALPGPGRYRMFLDFQVDGVVRTAEFTVVIN